MPAVGSAPARPSGRLARISRSGVGGGGTKMRSDLGGWWLRHNHRFRGSEGYSVYQRSRLIGPGMVTSDGGDGLVSRAGIA